MDLSKKQPTGIKGLDVVLKGGLPQGRGLLLIGGPGTGKTILLAEFLYRGITEYKQNGVFVTFEERPKHIIENLRSLSWDFNHLVTQKKLIFVDASPNTNYEEIGDFYNLKPLLERIKYAIAQTKAQRVTLDGLGNLFAKFSNKKMIREILYHISDELKRMGISYMISTEKNEIDGSHHVEEYVSDGVLDLSKIDGQNEIIRKMQLIKMRGASYLSNKITFEIGQNGIAVYPPLEMNEPPAKIFSGRCKFGIPGLDKALGGGLPVGSVTVLVGSTGTGRTTLGARFLYEGLKNNQNAVCVSFKDSASAFENIGERYGWKFGQYIKQNKLIFITDSYYPDKLIYNVIGEIKRIKAKRVVIDSISFIDPLSAFPEKTTQFYISLMRWLKRNGITCIMNYLSTENDFLDKGVLFSSLEAPLRRVLNAIPDGIIVLRYMRQSDKITKQLSILKLRNSNHQKDFFCYDIDDDGFHFDVCKRPLMVSEEENETI